MLIWWSVAMELKKAQVQWYKRYVYFWFSWIKIVLAEQKQRNIPRWYIYWSIVLENKCWDNFGYQDHEFYHDVSPSRASEVNKWIFVNNSVHYTTRGAFRDLNNEIHIEKLLSCTTEVPQVEFCYNFKLVH